MKAKVTGQKKKTQQKKKRTDNKGTGKQGDASEGETKTLPAKTFTQQILIQTDNLKATQMAATTAAATRKQITMQYINTIKSLNFEFTINADSTVTVKAKTDAAKFLFRVKGLGRKASNAASGNEVFDLIAQYEQKLVILAGV